jgi:Carboxypeptidase regulatory-like domain
MPLFAQSTQSTILGTVKDPAGAVIASAQVVISDTDKGNSSTLLTDKSGDFQAQDLPPGRYEIQVSKAGFQSKLISDVALGARQHLRIDVDLAVGTAKQEITVDAANEGAIETETASIASTLDSQSVMNLPANFRASGSTSPLNLVQALPGVQPDTAAGTNSPTANGTPSVSFSVQGGQPFQTETSVDGISTQNVSNNTPLSDAFPSAESIAEMRVEGVNNNAEFGQAGEITTVTKSGANQVHGSAFWYAQNRAFDAVAFGTPIDPATGKAEKPEKIGNDFGGSIGGPVVIPHLYNGRDKTFFFGTYEGFRFPRQTTIRNLVPTQLMQQGDFSQEVPVDSGVLFDPFTGGLYDGNVVSPVSAQIKPFQQFFPLPNVGSYQTVAEAEAGAGYNYAANRDSAYNSNQFDARVDERFNQKLQGFARFTFKDLTLLDPQDLNVQSLTDFDNYRILASSLIYTFTPSLLNEFRFGFTNETNGIRNELNGAPYTAAAGFQPIGPTYPVSGITVIYFPGGLTTLEAGNINQTSQSHLFQYTDNLTWSKGKHTLKYGADIRTLESITTLGDYGINNVTAFVFTGNVTGALLPDPTPAQYADVMAGTPVETQYFTLVPRNDGKSVYYGFYAQDQWQALSNLTISYGLRYEYHPAYHDVNGAIGNFDPSTPNTGAVIYPTGHQDLLDPSFLANFDACGYGPPNSGNANCTPVLSSSQAHLPSSLRKSQLDRFLPRIGLAWRPFNDEKTVVSTGFGVYNTTLLGSIFFSLTDTLQAASLVYQNSFTENGLAYAWPQTSPGGTSANYGTASFNTANKIDWKDPYSMQWNLSVDRQFAGNIGTRISYIAMKTDQLVWGPNLNDMSYSSTTPAQQRPLTDRPFPNWGVVNTHTPGAQATYESLQLEANHHFQHGFGFESAYTWAKNLADNQGPQSTAFAAENGGNNGQNSTYLNDRGLDFGNVYGTRRHRWINTGVYKLPFGRGAAFGSNISRLEDAFVGGWQLSSIFLWQTGPYLTAYIPGNDADPSGTGSGILAGRDQHPDIIGKIVPAHRTRDQWVNPNAFACPSNTGYTSSSYAGNYCGVGVTSNPIGRFGTESVGDIEGPGTVNWSAGVSKQIAITERVHIRGECSFTNVLNHTNLNDPALDITNPNFGKITSARGSDFGGNRTGQISMRLEF